MLNDMGLDEIRRLKEQAKLPKQKSNYRIPAKSKKKLAQEAEEKKLRGDDDTLMEQWFKARRKELTGICQCGCGNKSQKHDDTFFRGSCCHIFPKAIFESIMYHPLNCVERAMMGGCHHNMDNQGMDKWPLFADWDDIKERFHVLAPLLTDKERGHKFYSLLEPLIYKH
jgi:hypothetical protein